MKMTLAPEWEAKLQPNMYGFRPGRSCHDAIEAVFNALTRKTAYILEAAITECFDKMDQNVLLEKLKTTPTYKRIIKGWLSAGVMEDGNYIATQQGTIQGGTISPLLASVALHGLVAHIKKEQSKELFQYMKKKRGKSPSREAQRYISVII